MRLKPGKEFRSTSPFGDPLSARRTLLAALALLPPQGGEGLFSISKLTSTSESFFSPNLICDFWTSFSRNPDY